MEPAIFICMACSIPLNCNFLPKYIFFALNPFCRMHSVISFHYLSTINLLILTAMIPDRRSMLSIVTLLANNRKEPL